MGTQFAQASGVPHDRNLTRTHGSPSPTQQLNERCRNQNSQFMEVSNNRNWAEEPGCARTVPANVWQLGSRKFLAGLSIFSWAEADGTRDNPQRAALIPTGESRDRLPFQTSPALASVCNLELRFIARPFSITDPKNWSRDLRGCQKPRGSGCHRESCGAASLQPRSVSPPRAPSNTPPCGLRLP